MTKAQSPSNLAQSQTPIKTSFSMSQLQEILATQCEMAEELPLVHTSRCESLSGIVAAQRISPTQCPVFHENLVYLFYGRPAYRSTRGQCPGESTSLCPVCFVFKPRTISTSISKLFPCDTGAAAAELFTPHITKADLDNLELDPRIDNARRMVSLFFKTNTEYFYGHAITTPSFPSTSIAFRFHQLLLQKGKVPYDDRRSAIEIVLNKPVSLKGNLAFVVLPQEFLDDLSIRKAILEDWDSDPYPYSTMFGASPAECYPLVRQRIEDYLKRTTRIT